VSGNDAKHELSVASVRETKLGYNETMLDPSADPAPGSRAGLHVLRWAGALLALAVLAVALYSLGRNLGGLSRSEIVAAFHAVPARRIWLCGLLTGISYLTLGSYDVIAIRSMGLRRISAGRAWFAGADATAISNTLGFHALTATAVRYRLFTRSGLTGSQVAGVTALSTSALAVGFGSVLAAAMIASSSSGGWQRAGGLALLVILLAGIRLLGTGRQISFCGFRLKLPSTRMALAQMVLGAVEMASAIGALYVLIPESFAASFPAFCALYIGAVLLGIVSHAPGGLGVFEAAVLAGSPVQGRAGILAALLLYRLIYNLGPFLLAAAALAGEETRAAFSSRADKP
jgi:uncharacterized membrane protein YbhN (UPF0104 family)